MNIMKCRVNKRTVFNSEHKIETSSSKIISFQERRELKTLNSLKSEKNKQGKVR